MNIFYKAYCRVYQSVMYVAAACLKWNFPERIEGQGSLKKLPGFLKDKGFKSALLVTDANLMKLGLAQPIIDAAKEDGIKLTIFDEVVPNPTIKNIEDGLKLYKANDCDVLIALGGGSSMDCAKGIGARVANPNKTIPQMKGLLKVGRTIPPLVAIPTTSGTGSEATLAAVVSDPSTKSKYAMNDTHLIPKYAVLDPDLTVGLPQHITSTTGMDALTHAVEAYIGRENTKDTKKYAIEATQLIFKYLERAYNDGHDIEARSQMQKASLLAGMAFTRAYVGYVHAIAHTLGGFYGVPHGYANAVILPHVLDKYGKTAWKKLAELADCVGITGADDEEKAKKFIQEIKDMNKRMNIPTRIEGKWHIEEADIPTMVDKATHEANPLYPCPDMFDKDQIRELFEEIK